MIMSAPVEEQPRRREQDMSCTVDMALDTGEERTAAALHVALSGMDVFLLFEVERATPPCQQLLPVALSAVVGSLSVPVGSSPARNLETALQAANRAVHDARLRNPAAGEGLVSAVVVSRKEGRFAVAGVGANAAYLRTPGEIRRVFAAETVSAKLIEDGITSELTDENDRAGSSPTNGLGVAPEMFEIRQSLTVDEPPRCELVLCGAGVAADVAPAHMESIPVVTPVHDTARRLYRVFWSRKGKGSGVLAAQCRAGADAPLVDHSDFERPPTTFPRTLLWLGAAAIAVLGVAFFYFWPGGAKKPVRKGDIPPATSLLPSKPLGGPGGPSGAGLKDVAAGDDARAATAVEVVAPDLVAPAGDAGIAGKRGDAVVDSRGRGAAEAGKADKSEEKPRKRKKRKARRKKRKPAEPRKEEPQVEKAEEAPAGGAAEVRDPDFPDVTIQVMDFTQPEDVREQKSEAPPENPGFPMAKEFPDVQAAPDQGSGSHTEDEGPLSTPDVHTPDVVPASTTPAAEIASEDESEGESEDEF